MKGSGILKLSKFDYSMLEKDRQVSYTSTYDKHSLGCVIAYKKHIIAMASNSEKTHPMQKRYNRKYMNFTKSKKPIVDSGHAEILALADIPYPLMQSIDWKQVRVYVYRISPGKRLGHGLARPCKACMAALRDKGVKHVYFTTDDGFGYEELY